ncbi:MAG: hypothetical protein JXR03_06695, partial [Cyclobacteriaceae bacterium]
SGTAEPGSSVSVVVNGETSTTRADAVTGAWSITTNTLGEGTYDVAVTTTDAAGNMSTDTTTNELEIDTTDPIDPTVGSVTTNDTTPTISGTAEPGSSVSVVVNG